MWQIPFWGSSESPGRRTLHAGLVNLRDRTQAVTDTGNTPVLKLKAGASLHTDAPRRATCGQASQCPLLLRWHFWQNTTPCRFLISPGVSPPVLTPKPQQYRVSLDTSTSCWRKCSPTKLCADGSPWERNRILSMWLKHHQ